MTITKIQYASRGVNVNNEKIKKLGSVGSNKRGVG